MSHDLLVQMAYSVGPHLDQCYLHKPVHPIMLAHSILMRRFSLGLWIPWRHFWNEFQVLQHLKEQDFKSCVMPREINYLVWASVPTACQYVRHTFGWFTHIRHMTFEVPFPVFWSSFSSIIIITIIIIIIIIIIIKGDLALHLTQKKIDIFPPSIMVFTSSNHLLKNQLANSDLGSLSIRTIKGNLHFNKKITLNHRK